MIHYLCLLTHSNVHSDGKNIPLGIRKSVGDSVYKFDTSGEEVTWTHWGGLEPNWAAPSCAFMMNTDKHSWNAIHGGYSIGAWVDSGCSGAWADYRTRENLDAVLCVKGKFAFNISNLS